MADIFEALSQIRKASGTNGTAVADTEPQGITPSPDSGDIFSTLDSIRALAEPPKGRPPDEINPPIAPTTLTTELIKNTPGALAQGAVDLAKNVASAGKTAIGAAQTAGGDIMDALAEIRKPGTMSAALEAIPETAAQIAKDIGGVVTKAGAGFTKGVTLGAINPEQGTVGIPFTSKKWEVAPKLADALKTMGVSEEIADNAYVGTGPELAGAIAPWSRISKAVGLLAKSAKAAVSTGEITTQAAAKTDQFLKLAFGTPLKQKAAEAGLRVAQEGITGGVVGAAQVRDPGQSALENAKHTAMFGAGLGAAAESVGLGASYLKAKEVRRFYENLSQIFYETKVKDPAAAELMAQEVIEKVIRKGGIDNISHGTIKDSRQALDDVLENLKKEPKAETARQAPTETTVDAPPPVQIQAPLEPTTPAPVAGPDVYPEVTGLEASTTPGMTPAPAAPATLPKTNIIDALNEVRAPAPIPVTETPHTPSGPQALEPPPEQKGLSVEEAKAQGYVLPETPEAIPPKEGPAYALEKGIPDPISGKKMYDIFGNSPDPAQVHKGTFYEGAPQLKGLPVIQGIYSPMSTKPQGAAFTQAKGADDIAAEMSPVDRKAFKKAYEENDKLALMKVSMDAKQQGEIYTAIRNEAWPETEAEPPSSGGGGYALDLMPRAEPPVPEDRSGQGELLPPTPTAPGPPEATHEAPIFELPEMVQLAKELMEGKFPQVVKSIRTGSGNALGVFYPGKGIIKIRADQFQNPEEAAHTLSHEVGHLSDWLPEKDIQRGNVIGRIASLQKHMKNEFIGESFEKHLYNNKKFRDELITLTHRWHPFDASKAGKEYLSYRYSAVELYAEAWSVLLNNPKFLKDTAPAFYKALFDYLDRKPDVKALYEDLGEVIREGRTAETRHQRETAAYAKGDLAAKLKNEAKGHPLRTIWDEMREALVDVNSKMISSVAKARKAGEDIPAGENPLHALEELRYSSAELSDYAKEQGNIYHKLKDAGIEWNDLGAYLKADRVINERSEMANPGGQTPKAAGEEIAHLEQKYGKKFADLKAAADEMRGPRREYLIQELEKSKMLSPQLLEKIKKNKAYSPFDILIDEVDKKLGGTSSNVGPQIYSQIGTLRDIKNPATALVMKDLALLRAIRVQQAKLKQAEWMLKREPTWITDAETKWNGVAHVPVEPADRENTGLLAFYENGKIRAYYVPRTIADSFRYDPPEASLMMDAWDRMNSFFKLVFTAANPGFQVMNVPRDLSSLVMHIRGMSYSKAIRYYIKVAGSAKRFATGEHDPLIQEMLRRKILITPQNRWSSVAHDVEMESIINRFSDKENEYERWYSKAFGPLLDRIKMIGQMGESIAKIGGFQYLKDNQARFGLTDQDINHLIRFQAGSPPFLIGGKQTRVISRVLLFFNPHVQGYRRSFEAARFNPGEYTAKLMKYVFLPKLIQYLFWAGVFGESARRLSRKFSSYNQANYHVIPLGDGPNGKGIGLKIPMDDTERFLGGLLWYALTSQPVAKTMAMLGYSVPKGDFGQDFTKLFAYAAGQAPNLTPGIGALVDLVQYASGHNPYDYFRGKPGIPERVFEAKGKRSHEAMLKYELNQLGAGLVYRFPTGDLQKVKSDLEKVLGAPVVGNVLSRFLMSTNYGESEMISNAVAIAKERVANRRLDYREAVVQNIMAHDKPAGLDEIAKLYGDMMKDGLLGDALHLKRFSEFKGFYQRLQSQRLDDPYATGLMFAADDDEKAAVLDVAKENLSEEDYNKLVGYSLTQKFIHAKTLVSDEFRKAKKK